MSIGQRMLEKLTSTSLFRIERVGENHIIVWSSGSEEQLEAMVNEAMHGVPEKIEHWKGDADDACNGKYGPSPKDEPIDFWRGRREVLYELSAFLNLD
jgi:hypothetical protein